MGLGDNNKKVEWGWGARGFGVGVWEEGAVRGGGLCSLVGPKSSGWGYWVIEGWRGRGGGGWVGGKGVGSERWWSFGGWRWGGGDGGGRWGKGLALEGGGLGKPVSGPSKEGGVRVWMGRLVGVGVGTGALAVLELRGEGGGGVSGGWRRGMRAGAGVEEVREGKGGWGGSEGGSVTPPIPTTGGGGGEGREGGEVGFGAGGWSLTERNLGGWGGYACVRGGYYVGGDHISGRTAGGSEIGRGGEVAGGEVGLVMWADGAGWEGRGGGGVGRAGFGEWEWSRLGGAALAGACLGGRGDGLGWGSEAWGGLRSYWGGFITIHDYLPQAIICVCEVLHQTSCIVGRDLDLNEFFLFRVSLQALIPLVSPNE
ncbi:hypothetical protein Tco_0453731 [Tanacetum coccineum]